MNGARRRIYKKQGMYKIKNKKAINKNNDCSWPVVCNVQGPAGKVNLIDYNQTSAKLFEGAATAERVE